MSYLRESAVESESKGKKKIKKMRPRNTCQEIKMTWESLFSKQDEGCPVLQMSVQWDEYTKFSDCVS